MYLCEPLNWTWMVEIHCLLLLEVANANWYNEFEFPIAYQLMWLILSFWILKSHMNNSHWIFNEGENSIILKIWKSLIMRTMGRTLMAVIYLTWIKDVTVIAVRNRICKSVCHIIVSLKVIRSTPLIWFFR